MKEIVHVAEVTKKYKNGRGIEAISMSLYEGEIHVLLGANGAGKSTLMRVIAGLAAPDSGEIRLSGKTGLDGIRGRLHSGGFLIEQPEPFGYLTAMENLMQKARYYPSGLKSAERALQMAGLSKHRDEKAGTFSTGMKQRLGLAMALTGAPEYLVLDEPSNGLDIEGRADIHQLLGDLRKSGIPVLLSTHLVHEAEQLADRITIIHEGKLLESILKKELPDQAESLEKWYLKRIRQGLSGLEAAV
jgi:ABC-2 type transport system ATP-binding protein